jgi:hypothetical protein
LVRSKGGRCLGTNLRRHRKKEGEGRKDRFHGSGLVLSIQGYSRFEANLPANPLDQRVGAEARMPASSRRQWLRRHQRHCGQRARPHRPIQKASTHRSPADSLEIVGRRV